MKNILWVQNPHVEQANIMIIDGKRFHYGESVVTEEAKHFLHNGKHIRYADLISWSSLKKKYKLSPSFKFCVSKYGTYLQASTMTTDDYGRHLPLLYWADTTNFQTFMKDLVRDVQCSGMELDSNLFVALKKANDKLRFINFVCLSIIIIIITLIGILIWKSYMN